MDSNCNPDIVDEVGVSHAMLLKERGGSVGPLDFEALGPVVEGNGPDVVKDAGGEEKGKPGGCHPGGTFPYGECAGIEIDADAVGEDEGMKMRSGIAVSGLGDGVRWYARRDRGWSRWGRFVGCDGNLQCW